MPRITIDGKQFEVENGLTILQAAVKNGITIPYFCWHPALSISGNCRMCLVEVEKLPKLVIACSTLVTDGMVVHTQSPKAIDAREAVMEFLLINHPLDCPICDEAGQCKLQDYAYKYSVGYSRFDENKNEKSKRVLLGPNVVFDAERCISCSRCIRFCDEIAKQSQLTFVQRGDRVTIVTFPGEQLDNPYSMNTIDICPVGALTSRDFRFKARVWEMSATESICPSCSRGCNMLIWVRNNEVLRLTPRENLEVNQYWMCDNGRLNYKFINAPDRVKSPMVRRNGELVEVGWDEAISRVASELKAFEPEEIAAIGSAYSTNEDNYVFQKFIKQVLGIKYIDFIRHIKEDDEDDILIKADKTPNSLGAEEVGIKPNDDSYGLAGILKGIKEGKIKALYVMDEDLMAVPEFTEAIGKLDFLVVHAWSMNKTAKLANVVLSSATYAEKDGTFTNFQGRVQRIRPAVVTMDNERYMQGFSASRWDKFGSQFDRWGRGARRDARPSWKILTQVAALFGAKFKYEKAEDVFIEIAQTVEKFKGLTYQKIGIKGERYLHGLDDAYDYAVYDANRDIFQ